MTARDPAATVFATERGETATSSTASTGTAELRALARESSESLDALVRSLARLTGAPIALVTIVADDAIHLVARHGVDVERVDLAPGLCATAVDVDDLYVVADTHADELAAANPLVTGPLGVRSYVAVPIRMPDGRRLGNLCLLDHQVRELHPDHVDALWTFARLVADQLELRRRTERLDQLEADLVAAETARVAAAERFVQLAESMPLMVWTATADGVVDYANDAYLRYVGAERGSFDLAGGDWLDTVHPDDRDELRRTAVAHGHGDEPYALDFRIRRHDGVYRWHRADAYPIKEADGTVTAWFGAVTDVHDQRRAVQRLTEQERYLRAILEHGPECVKVVAPDGELLEMNPAGLDMVEAVSFDEVRGCPVFELIHPDDVETFERLHRTASAGARVSATFRIVGRQGGVRWAESTSVPLDPDAEGASPVLSVTRDVSGRHRESILQAVEARILEQLVAGTTLDAVLHEIVTALDQVNAGASSIMFVDRDRLRHGAAVHLPADYLDVIAGIEIGPEVGSCGAAAALGERIVTTDIAVDPRWEGFREHVVAAGLAACTSTPVFDSAGRVVAVVAHYLRESRATSVAEDAATDRMARLASLAIERIRADQSLRQTTALLRVASRLGHLGGWSVDLPTSSVVWSDEVAAIHDRPAGYRPTVDEGIGYYAPEYRSAITDAFTACVERGEPYDLEVEIITAAGRRRWCRTVGEAERDASGRIVRVAGAFQDVTESKASERALRESEERFRLLSEATSDVVFDWDLASGSVWYGDGLEEMVGALNDPAVTIDGVMRRIHPDDLERVRHSLVTVMDGGGEVWEERFRLRRSDGEDLPVEVSGFVLRDADGRVTRLVGSLIDVSARLALEEQLAQSQRLEAVGQLTGGVAHDFNNLLTVIIGNADLLVDDLDAGHPPDPDELRSAIDMVRAAAERGTELTARLLAFARRQPLAPVTVDVPALLDGLTGLLRRTLGEDVEVRVTRRDGTWPATVDPAQLESAVLNVCLNARDAMPGGGRLSIETSNAVLDGDVLAEGDAVEPGDYVSIAITDDGFGMPADVVRRAFEPFFTTKPPGRGSGLGLSMVYGFARQSRGHVRIYSEPGHGTTVRLYLPRATGGTPEVPGVPQPRERRSGSERILLVEDDELVREMAATQLRTLGYQVVEASDGPSALALVRDAGPFSLLFTDVVMPGGMNGRQLADAVRQLAPDLPVLFTSGYTEDAIVHHGQLDAGVELLAKPYRLDDLAERVRGVLDAGR